jgi:tetratricopeptide (TPR) repeat protein
VPEQQVCIAVRLLAPTPAPVAVRIDPWLAPRWLALPAPIEVVRAAPVESPIEAPEPTPCPIVEAEVETETSIPVAPSAAAEAPVLPQAPLSEPSPARAYVEAPGAVATDPADDDEPGLWIDEELPPLPRVSDVLQAVSVTTGPSRERSGRSGRKAARSATALPPTCVEPSAGEPPALWRLPAWAVVTPVALGLMAAGGLAVALSLQWQADDRLTASLIQRLESVGPNDEPFEPPSLPTAKWWRSSARNLAIQAQALDRADSDGMQRDAVAERLYVARLVSPLEPVARAAPARLNDEVASGTPDRATLGLSRDVLTLRRSSKKLLDAGRLDAALAAFRKAIELALESDLDDEAIPAFLDDYRFALPREAMITPIVADLLESASASADSWRSSLPDSGLVRLVAARLLRKRGDDAASQVLDELIAKPADPGADAVALAIRAEALALRERWSESGELWNEAVRRGGVPEAVARTWWFNLAEVEARAGRPDRALQAWEQARCSDLHDPVNQRLAEARARHGNLSPAAVLAGTGAPGDPLIRRAAYTDASSPSRTAPALSLEATPAGSLATPTLVPDRPEER